MNAALSAYGATWPARSARFQASAVDWSLRRTSASSGGARRGPGTGAVRSGVGGFGAESCAASEPGARSARAQAKGSAACRCIGFSLIRVNDGGWVSWHDAAGALPVSCSWFRRETSDGTIISAFSRFVPRSGIRGVQRSRGTVIAFVGQLRTTCRMRQETSNPCRKPARSQPIFHLSAHLPHRKFSLPAVSTASRHSFPQETLP